MKPVILCVWVQGHVPYGAIYVRRLKAMVERNLSREYDFICLTDRPSVLRPDKIDTITVPTPPNGVFAWWMKNWLFSPYHQQLVGRRCVYFDLDVGILKPVDPIIDYPSSFALVPDDAPNFKGKGARVTVKKFNSSVMVWDGGTNSDLFTEFTYSATKRLWGDQDWIGERYADKADTMPLEWFPRLSQCANTGPSDAAKVILCKKPKPLVAAQAYPWFGEVWT